MADTQPAPAPDATEGVHQLDGGIESATEALLGLLKPETSIGTPIPSTLIRLRPPVGIMCRACTA